MKKCCILLLVLAFLIGFANSSYAIPSGAQFSVDESNDPLVLGFTGLTGSLSFDYFIETDWASGQAWDAVIFKDDPNSGEIDRIYLLATSSDWVPYTLTDAVLTGSVNLIVYLDDYGTSNDVAMYFKDFSSTPTYLRGGQAIPEPATMLLLGTSLIGLAVIGRKKLYKK